jgi:hypothetical protein
MFQAAVEYADEAVGQGAEGLVVGGAGGAVVVVVAAGAVSTPRTLTTAQ